MDSQQQRGGRAPWAFADRRVLASVAVLFIAAMVVVLASFSTKSSSLSTLHQIPEGHVGVYWRGGALLKTLTDPGFHMKMPLITQFQPIQVTLQTDQVKDIPCGTKSGVMISFERIEVVNRLRKEYVYETLLQYGVHYDHTWIYDKIHHEINQFCSAHTLQQVYIDMFDQIADKMKDALQGDCTRHAPGIEILIVRVMKPTIPASIKRNFEQMEEERTKDLIAMEKLKVAEKEAEILKKMAITEAEKNVHLSKIHMEQKLMEKDNTRKEQEIENQIYTARVKTLDDADFYRQMKEAIANNFNLLLKCLGSIILGSYTYRRFQSQRSNPGKNFSASPSMVFAQRLLEDFEDDVKYGDSN